MKAMKALKIANSLGAAIDKGFLLINAIDQEKALFLSRWFHFAQRERDIDETLAEIREGSLPPRTIIFASAEIIDAEDDRDRHFIGITDACLEKIWDIVPDLDDREEIEEISSSIYLEIDTNEGPAWKWVGSTFRCGSNYSFVTSIDVETLEKDVFERLFWLLENEGFLRPISDGNPEELLRAVSPWIVEHAQLTERSSIIINTIVRPAPLTLITASRFLPRGQREIILSSDFLPILRWDEWSVDFDEMIESVPIATVWAERPDGSRKWICSVATDSQVVTMPYLIGDVEHVAYWMTKLFCKLEELGVLAPLSEWSGKICKPAIEVSLGGDPEFELLKDGRLIEARETEYSSLGEAIGRDGAGYQIELRPEPSTNPQELVRNIRSLLRELYSNGYDVSATGDIHPLGGHIHFGLSIRPEDVEVYVEALDDFIGRPTQILSGKARQNSEYGRLGDYRLQPHGFEYRTVPTAVWSHPRMAQITLTMAKALVQSLANGKVLEYNEEPTVEDYVRLTGVGEKDVRFFLGFCKKTLHRKFTVAAAWKLDIDESPATAVKLAAGSVFEPWAMDEVRTVFQDVRLMSRILLFGLSEQRGNVFNFPCSLGKTIKFCGGWNPYTSYGFSWESRRDRGLFRKALEDLKAHLLKTKVAISIKRRKES